MTTPTSNAVPSKDPRDLLFNAERIDEAVNTSALQYLDRFGMPRQTMAGAIDSIKAVNPRGAWVTATVYATKDVVTSGGVAYICIDSHTSGATFAGDLVARWRVYQGVLVSDLANTSDATKGAGMVGYRGRTVYQKLGDWIDPMDLGAVGDGAADDLTICEQARDLAASLGVPLLFTRLHGIGDTFYFADGGHAFFAPGAGFKLLNSTSTGGAVSGPYPTQTKQIQIHNLFVNCNNISGENGAGFGNIVNARIFNPRVINCLHDPITYGGKAIQFEGTAATDVQVFSPSVENCTVGLDFGAVNAAQSVHIGVFNASMRDVDIPIYINDSTTTNPADDWDKMEIVVDGLHCRNCGRLTFGGATATGGGIIVADRGYKITVLNIQVVNDKGLYGSTDYGTIGALVRGTALGLTLGGSCVIRADVVAPVDFTQAAFQSPGGGSYAPYIFCDTVIQHHGNLDYCVKTYATTGAMGPARIRMEIGSTLATPAGIVDTNAAAYTGAYLEVIDRNNGFLTTGLRSMAMLNADGNALNGNTVGLPSPSQKEGAWTPADASGATLSFSNITAWQWRDGDRCMAVGSITYPATANASNARIRGLTFLIGAGLYNRYGGTLTFTSSSSVAQVFPTPGTDEFALLGPTGAAVTNATMSGVTIGFQLTYKPA